MARYAIVTIQVLLASVVVAIGAELVCASAASAQRLASVGLGGEARVILGTLEIVAGLCLLAPRGACVATALLAILTVGVVGIAIGQSAPGRTAALQGAAPRLQVAVDSFRERSRSDILTMTAKKPLRI
jgi:hypothetical protein